MDSDIPGALAGIVSLGCLVSIGTTRDRGAFSITITHEGDWDREYFRTSTDALEWLEAATRILQGRITPPNGADRPTDQKPVRRRSRLA